MSILVSIIIPCRNEEKFIAKCLDSIISQDFPKEKIEVLVVDGMSVDRTRKILKKYQRGFSFVKMLDNPKKFTPSAMNIGIKKAKGKVIMKIDAHSVYKKDYLTKCLDYLIKYKADAVGGRIITLPSKNTFSAKAIALSLSHQFGVGNSHFRAGVKKPEWADTAFGVAYQKEVFDKIGLFNENLIRSQDMELNLRLKRAGGKILLAPDIISYYYPKSNLKDFFLHNFKDAIWPTYQLKFTKKLYCLRHYLPPLFLLALVVFAIGIIFWFPFIVFFLSLIGIYFLLAFYFSFKIVLLKKEWRYLFLLPLAFACRHFGHGLGSLFGILKIFI